MILLKNLSNHKKILAFGLAGWLSLAGFSVIKYSGIINKTCNWQTSWLFCSPEIGTLQKIILFTVIFLVFGVFIIYGRYTWFLMEENNTEPNKWFGLPLIAGFLFLASLVVPFGSGDMNYYYNSGKDLSAGYNVYAQDWPLKNELSYSSQENLITGFSYGPITASLFKAAANLSPNINVFVIIWRLIMILFFCLGALVVSKLIGVYGLNLKKKDFYLLWFLQPLLLFEWVVNGHFDGLWLLFVMLAFVLARKKLWELVIPCLVIGIWIKFIPLFVTPWFMLWWWQDMDKLQWPKRLGQALLGVVLGAAITYFAWLPYWAGPGIFKSVVYQSKWVVSSYFGLIYYSLSPLFKWFLADGAHWYLTRLVHLVLLVAVVYFLYPYFKKVILIILKRVRWDDFDYYQAIFITLFVYLFVWQKSFWPWYVVWLLPAGLLLFLKHKNIFLKRIIIWVSLAPLVFYPIWIFALQTLGVYAENQLWFYYLFVPAVSAYPLYNFIKWRKLNYNNDAI